MLRRKDLISTMMALFLSVLFLAPLFTFPALSSGDEAPFTVEFPGVPEDENGTAYLKIDRGKRSVVRFTVTNDLATEQEFSLKLFNVSDWDISFSGGSNNLTLRIDSGNTAESNIWITAAESGENHVGINVSAGGKYVKRTLRLICVPPAITLSAPERAAKAYAGESVVLPFTVRNTGGEMDNITLSLSRSVIVGGSPLPGSWVANLSASSISLPPDSNGGVNLTVYAPTGGSPNEKVVVGVIAYSSNRQKEYAIDMEVSIRSIFDLTVEPARVVRTVWPGGVVEYELRVNNTGNDLLTVQPRPTNVPENWLPTVLPLVADIPPEEGRTFNVKIAVDPEALSAVSKVEIDLVTKQGPERSSLAEVTVRSVTEISLSADTPPSLLLYPGEDRLSRFTLKSRSNHDQTVELSVGNLSGNMWAYFESLTLDRKDIEERLDLNGTADLRNGKGVFRPEGGQRTNTLSLLLSPFQRVEVGFVCGLTSAAPDVESPVTVIVNAFAEPERATLRYNYTLIGSKLSLGAFSIDEEEIGGKALTLAKGATHEVKVAIRNELSVKTRNITVSLYVNEGREPMVRTIPSIQGNSSETVTFNWNEEGASGEENIVYVEITDPSGKELDKRWAKIYLAEKKESVRISGKYLALSAVFLVALAVILIYLIKFIKQGRSSSEEDGDGEGNGSRKWEWEMGVGNGSRKWE